MATLLLQQILPLILLLAIGRIWRARSVGNPQLKDLVKTVIASARALCAMAVGMGGPDPSLFVVGGFVTIVVGG